MGRRCRRSGLGPIRSLSRAAVGRRAHLDRERDRGAIVRPRSGRLIEAEHEPRRGETTDASGRAGRDDPGVNVLIIVNDQPYGSERPYNALRLASALSRREEAEVRVFLMGDAVACAVADQRLPEGHYHLDRMLKPLGRRGEVACCGTCLDARGLDEGMLVEGARRSSMDELASWTLWADRAVTF